MNQASVLSNIAGFCSLVFLITGISFYTLKLPGVEMNIYMGCIYFLFAFVIFLIAPESEQKKTSDDVLDRE